MQIEHLKNIIKIPLTFMQNIINVIYKIDKIYNIYLVITEPTFLHELLIAVYMNSCGAKGLHPRPDRFSQINLCFLMV